MRDSAQVKTCTDVKGIYAIATISQNLAWIIRLHSFQSRVNDRVKISAGLWPTSLIP